MTFIDFCEAIIERPLLERERKLIKYLEEHPDAKVAYFKARGLVKMPYQEWLSILYVLYKDFSGNEIDLAQQRKGE